MQALAAGLEELLGVLTSLVTGLAFSQVRMFGVDWRRYASAASRSSPVS